MRVTQIWFQPTEQLHHQCRILLLILAPLDLTVPIERWNANPTLQAGVNAGFVLQLRHRDPAVLEFDANRPIAIFEIDSCVDITERAPAEPLGHLKPATVKQHPGERHD